jgi:tetratricopeptide (TPR) repeat protein
MASISPARKLLAALFCLGVVAWISTVLSGCSAGQKGLLTITPEQYFYSAKESLETIDERNYEIRDLDEIIRILENAEKDAKKSDIIDKSRMYLVLANTLKARKIYQTALMKGEYVANRAEPFFVVNTKEVKETLRIANKWLRSCNAQFKTNLLQADLNFVRGLYFTQKMLTQHSRERKESLETAVKAFRRCLGQAPEFKADFRLFGRDQTTREVRMRLIESLALGGQQADAYGLLTEYGFSAIQPAPGTADIQDAPWNHMRGLTLAMMGRYDEAVEVLEKFKIIVPQDYPQVDEALWLLEGVFDRLADVRNEDRYKMEARIVAAMLKKLKGPFSKEQYSTSAHLYPRIMPGDNSFYEATTRFYQGQFAEAIELLANLHNRGLMSSGNRMSSRIMLVEAKLYAGQVITDDLLEEMLALSENDSLTPLQSERIAYLLARYVMDADEKFSIRRIDHEGQSFIKCITGKPWAIEITHRRGVVKRAKEPVRSRDLKKQEEEEGVKREPGSIAAEIYANKPEDWVVSANMYLITLPEMHLLGTGRIVGRESEDEGGWVFKDDQIDGMLRRKHYLAIFEYDNSDSEKSLQGLLFKPR